MTEVGHCPPISDYALISDMHSCCLVSRAGSIDWCCFPRLDSAAIFSRILDWGKGGYFHVAPVLRLAVEAASPLGWCEWADATVTLDRFGASAPGEVLFERFGFTPDRVAEKARDLVALEREGR